MPLVVHISNTDIELDSRIRKELSALSSELKNCKVAAIGVPESNISCLDYIDGVEVRSLSLLSRRLRWLPRAVRYFFELFEFTVLVLLCVRQIKLASAGSPCVVHCHDTFALPAGWLVKRVYGCRLVYDAHELESNKNGQNMILARATLAIEKFCWKKIDLLISVSDSILAWYTNNLGRKQNVLVLNSPVYDSTKTTQTIKRDDNYFINKYKIPKSSRIFVYLGILGPGRGIEMCISAFKEMDDRAQVVFIGFGRLEKMIEEASKKHTNIHFHPAVEHHEVVPLVSNADYGLCFVENASLSDYLCLPNKLFEYSFAGLKILASNFPEIEGTVKKYELGTCCEPTIMEIKSAVSSILDASPTYATRDISELSWERQAKRLTDAYYSILT